MGVACNKMLRGKTRDGFRHKTQVKVRDSGDDGCCTPTACPLWPVWCAALLPHNSAKKSFHYA